MAAAGLVLKRNCAYEQQGSDERDSTSSDRDEDLLVSHLSLSQS